VTGRPGAGRYLLVSPAVALLLVLGIAPLALILFISLQTSSSSALWQPLWTIGNYRKIAGDGFYAAVLGNSFRVGAITTLLCALISYPVGYHLARLRGALRSVAMFFVLCPLLVSTVINTLGWMVILGDHGVVNAAMRAVGLPGQQLLYTEFAVIVGLTHILVPFMALPLAAAIERIPVRLEEAARNLGAGPAGVFVLVILPLSLPGLFGGALIAFALAFSAVVTPMFLGGRTVRTIGPQIYDSVFTAFDWPFASALTAVVFLIATIAVLLSSRLGARRA
jgi:putative spermidine/putrescine transport system permease protein